MIRAFLLLTAVSLYVNGCNAPADDTGTIDITVLFDQTDVMQLKPEYASLQGIFDLTTHPDHEVVFRAGVIRDMQLNPWQEAHLLNAHDAEAANEQEDITYRTNCIRGFNTKVRHILASLLDTTRRNTELGHSECFSVIAQALTDLSSRKATKKYLLIYSDLLENGAVNIYGRSRTLCLKDTIAIRRQLLRIAPLPNRLNGIEVYLLYQPRTRDDDAWYTIMAAVYKGLLSERGANVTVSASNPFNTP